MAEVEIIVTDEIKCLKKEITSLRKDLGRAKVAKEELLTFDMLGQISTHHSTAGMAMEVGER